MTLLPGSLRGRRRSRGRARLSAARYVTRCRWLRVASRVERAHSFTLSRQIELMLIYDMKCMILILTSTKKQPCCKTKL